VMMSTGCCCIRGGEDAVMRMRVTAVMRRRGCCYCEEKRLLRGEDADMMRKGC
jgi:hypothetical protein